MLRTLGAVIASAGLAASTAAAQAPAPAPRPDAPPAAIAWRDWSDEAFAAATAQRKPILLYIEAHWSRATQWMNEKVLADPEVVRLVSEKWIPVRVDRDRRPDIDVRYQIAVGALDSGPAGWPLVVFLMDTGDALLGTSSVTAEDRFERRGLRTMLERHAGMVKAGPDYKPPARARARVMMAFDKRNTATRTPAVLPEIVDRAAAAAAESMDAAMGGFGPPPRYLPPFALELAATRFHRRGDEVDKNVLLRTLEGIERGGVHDRVGGGVHRLANDRAWRLPEFEKLLSYNAAMLTDFLLGWQATGREDFRRAASGTVDYLLGTLAAPDGGFYVGQWAAASGDEAKGLHYTWSADEFRAAVPESLAPTAGVLFHVVPEGEISLGPPPRNVLYLSMPREEAARRRQVDPEALRAEEEAILRALAGARARREAPPVERAVYVDSSSAAIVSLLEAHRALRRDDARAAAIKALERLVQAVPQGRPMLHRVEPPPDPNLDVTLALDHLMLARAALEGYEATGSSRWIDAARGMVDRAVHLFWDADFGGFLDVAADPGARGYLAIRRRVPADTAYPSLNSLAARVLDRLWMHTGEAAYRERAESCLKALVSITGEISVQDAGLALAMEAHLAPPARYVVVADEDDAAARDLVFAAGRIFEPGKVIQRLVPGRDDAALERLGLRGSGAPYAVVCRADRCTERARDEEELRSVVVRPPAPPADPRR